MLFENDESFGVDTGGQFHFPNNFGGGPQSHRYFVITFDAYPA
jgi:hypothetical protein